VTPFSEGLGGLAPLAVGAAPEQLEAVVVDAVAGPALDVTDDGTPPCVVDVVAAAAGRADDMVVMGRFTCHVCVLATREIDPLYRMHLGEQIEGPEDRRPTDPESTPSRVGHEIRSREMRRPSRDQLRDGAPGIGRSIAGVVEGGADRQGIGHDRQMIPSLS
jgi:hypothetical protein